MSRVSSIPAIRLKGVRQNNLKNFDLELPLNQLTVVTGLSGSGKSSLAFDTLFAEGQRRYIETFSPYARQFFDRMDKPQVDRIDGIPPAIAIDQSNSVRSTRSTVGTMTELCEYMKLLWVHRSTLFCRGCAAPVRKQPPATVWQELNRADHGHSAWIDRTVMVTFQLPLAERIPLAESLDLVGRQGFQRLVIHGRIVPLSEAQVEWPGEAPTSLCVVQDRLKLTTESRARFTEACEQAYHFGKGHLSVVTLDPASLLQAGEARRFSKGFHCSECDMDYREPSPSLFSFNNPVGACPSCKGFGRIITIGYHLAIPDRSLSLDRGAVKPWRTGTGADSQSDLTKACKAMKIPMSVPFEKLTEVHQRFVIDGDPDYGKDPEHQWPRAWYGVKGYFRWLESKAYKMHVRVLLSRYRVYTDCAECLGRRFRPDSLQFQISWPEDLPETGLPTEKLKSTSPRRITLSDFYRLQVSHALGLVDHWLRGMKASLRDPHFLVLSEVRSRLTYLDEVGLGYLTLDRPTRTLSGGETERVTLTTCLGTKLVNTLFVLDEPTVGLHFRDTHRLVRVLHRLRDAGNTVVVVEHEASVMRAADQILDLGPGQGELGGNLVFQGTYEAILRSKESLTGNYLAGKKSIEAPNRRPVGDPTVPTTSRGSKGKASARPKHEWLQLKGARFHNLKDVDVAIPLQRMVSVTGVSGSGKTTLIRDVLLPALQAQLQRTAGKTESASDDEPGAEPDPTDELTSGTLRKAWESLEGAEHLDRVVLVDQSALGRTPRSNPAVYTGAFEHIRLLFSEAPLAIARGHDAGAFSFNSAQGQCERCRGAGFEKIEMQFLSDVFVRCPDCQGRRYREHILLVKLQPPAPPSGRAYPETTDSSGWLLRESMAPAPMTGRPKERKKALAPKGSEVTPEWSIADMLEATVTGAIRFLSLFGENRHAHRACVCLRLLEDVGLGYLRLGQPINTLSGGECQRLKLVSYLADAAIESERKAGQGDRALARGLRTLFVFDEPTTGLHFEDVRVLLQVFHRLVDSGQSVLVIEHHLDVIRCSDWVIDLGPEAGERGGELVVAGSPDTVAKCQASHTGEALRVWKKGLQ